MMIQRVDRTRSKIDLREFGVDSFLSIRKHWSIMDFIMNVLQKFSKSIKIAFELYRVWNICLATVM